MSERLQKVLARAGLGSRRKIEEWIIQGRVMINGQLAKLGDKVDKHTAITVDGRSISPVMLLKPKCRVLLYNKPLGEVTSKKDDKNRSLVFDNLPKLTEGRWVAIGRLDVNTSGLLLFTNDGELASQLMHPSNEVEREYAVRIYGEVDKEMLAKMKKGVMLEDGMAKFESIAYSGGEGCNHWYHVVVREGRNRLVRRLWESQQVRVSRLIRIRYGAIALPRSLRAGSWDTLEQSGIDALRKPLRKARDR